MVNKAALLPAALLLLGGCAFFSSSLFPGYLAQAEMAIDLRDRVEELLAGRTNPLRSELFVLRNAAGEDFACLLLVVDYTPDRSLFILTPQERLLQISGQELDRLHLVDANGDFVVGRASYNPTDFSFQSLTAMQPEDAWKPAISNGSANFVFDAGWSSNLTYYEYDFNWGGRLGRAMELGAGSYELVQVFKDPAAVGAEVILVLRTSGPNGEAAVVVRTPQGLYSTPSAEAILDNYPYTLLNQDDLDPRRTCYTRKGIAAASYDGSVILYNLCLLYTSPSPRDS